MFQKVFTYSHAPRLSIGRGVRNVMGSAFVQYRVQWRQDRPGPDYAGPTSWYTVGECRWTAAGEAN